MKNPCVYILANREYGAIYIGVTSNLMARLYQHREGTLRGFTSRYGVVRLVRHEWSHCAREAVKKLAQTLEDQFD